jgi:hypothetical protein
VLKGSENGNEESGSELKGSDTGGALEAGADWDNGGVLKGLENGSEENGSELKGSDTGGALEAGADWENGSEKGSEMLNGRLNESDVGELTGGLVTTLLALNTVVPLILSLVGAAESLVGVAESLVGAAESLVVVGGARMPERMLDSWLKRSVVDAGADAVSLAGGVLEAASMLVDVAPGRLMDCPGSDVGAASLALALLDDGSVLADDGSALADDGFALADDGSVLMEDGSALTEDGSELAGADAESVLAAPDPESDAAGADAAESVALALVPAPSLVAKGLLRPSGLVGRPKSESRSPRSRTGPVRWRRRLEAWRREWWPS